jgi:hypothetical protein
MWTRHRQPQHCGAQLSARQRRWRGAAPAAATRDREAQDHEHAAEDVAGEQERPGKSPASRLEDRDGDITPTAPEPRATWDETVQPERRKHPRAWDDEPLPEGK